MLALQSLARSVPRPRRGTAIVSSSGIYSLPVIAVQGSLRWRQSYSSVSRLSRRCTVTRRDSLCHEGRCWQQRYGLLRTTIYDRSLCLYVEDHSPIHKLLSIATVTHSASGTSVSSGLRHLYRTRSSLSRREISADRARQETASLVPVAFARSKGKLLVALHLNRLAELTPRQATCSCSP